MQEAAAEKASAARAAAEGRAHPSGVLTNSPSVSPTVTPFASKSPIGSPAAMHPLAATGDDPGLETVAIEEASARHGVFGGVVMEGLVSPMAESSAVENRIADVEAKTEKATYFPHP